MFDETPRLFAYYRLFFDGSVCAAGTGGGWVLYGATTVQEDELREWQIIASCSFGMPADATVTICELEACLFGIAFIAAMSRGAVEARECLETWQTLKVRGVKTILLADMMN